MKLADDCHNCDLRSSCKQVVWGWGLPISRIMLIAEAPGKWEDSKGVPLIGKTGEETDWLLARHGIQRSDIYVTNVVKCRPKDNKDPKPHQLDACIPWLEEELRMVQPKLVISMGRFSTRYFIPDANMEMVNGIPFQMPDFTLIPIYHVAAGLHRPATMLSIQAGFQTIRDVWKGNRKGRHVEDEFKGREEYFELKDGDLDE